MTGQSLDITLSEAAETIVVTRDGLALTLRAVSEEDAVLLARFYDSLSADDMQFRFLSAIFPICFVVHRTVMTGQDFVGKGCPVLFCRDDHWSSKGSTG